MSTCHNVGGPVRYRIGTDTIGSIPDVTSIVRYFYMIYCCNITIASYYIIRVVRSVTSQICPRPNYVDLAAGNTTNTTKWPNLGQHRFYNTEMWCLRLEIFVIWDESMQPVTKFRQNFCLREQTYMYENKSIVPTWWPPRSLIHWG